MIDPTQVAALPWDLCCELWESSGAFVVDGSWKWVESMERLLTVHVPSLIIAGDGDECDPALAQETRAKITGAQLVISPQSEPMTLVDQQEMFNDTVNTFVHWNKPTTT
jgi:pimeloyl-ACP methyl ester carboxylesterase